MGKKEYVDILFVDKRSGSLLRIFNSMTILKSLCQCKPVYIVFLSLFIKCLYIINVLMLVELKTRQNILFISK